MEEIGVRELKEKASEVIRRVREDKQSYTVTYRGRVVARLVPADSAEEEDFEEIWADMDRLAEEIGKKWPKGLSPEEAVSEQRR